MQGPLRFTLRRQRPGFILDAALELPPDGTVCCLVGPSGSGKSSLLRLLAGLDRPDRGRIEVLGRCWFDGASGVHLPPQRRKVGMVFQDALLFPHLDVLDNVAFARMAHEGKRQARRSALRYLEMVRMAGTQRRMPDTLSGGQRQRVALARALAREPDLLLLDEPFSALDQVARRKLQQELLDLVHRLRCPVVFVTHDLQEAALLGDHVGVLHNGRLLQFAAASEVFFRPATVEIAHLVDMRNILPGRVLERTPQYTLVSWRNRVFRAEGRFPYPSGAAVYLGLRPQHLLVRRPDAPEPAENELPATVRRVLVRGPLAQVICAAQDHPAQELVLELSEHLLGRFALHPGGPVRLRLWPQRLHLMRREDEWRD